MKTIFKIFISYLLLVPFIWIPDKYWFLVVLADIAIIAVILPKTIKNEWESVAIAVIAIAPTIGIALLQAAKHVGASILCLLCLFFVLLIWGSRADLIPDK